MRGTCITCPVSRGEGENVVSYNFAQELERCSQIHEPDATFKERVIKLNRIVMEFLRRLALYAVLWHQDKQNVVEKWAHKKYRTTRDYELRIMTLQNWAISLGRLLGPLRIVYAGALALRLGSFYTCVMNNLRDWIRVYLRFLLESAQSLNSNATKIMQAKREVLKKRPVTLPQMKELLSIMTELRGGLCEMIDDTVIEMTERYRIIRQYGDPEFLEQIPEPEWISPITLRRRWNAIMQKSYQLAENVAPMKAQFAVGIVDVVKDFRKRVIMFCDKYKKAGPGGEANDLDRGVTSLSQFIKESEALEIERLDLLSSERLLDLPISSYPELKEIRLELAKLKPIYELYSKQKTMRQDWSLILWRDVKIGEIMDGMAGFIEEFKNNPRKVRTLPCARKLFTEMRNFQESLQLIVYLKDEALRDRHWKQLMEKTGISFDIDPLTFTLEGVFAMQLHQYSDNLEDIRNTWNELKFSFNLYTKCKGDPCPTLGNLEEPTKLLEDNMLNLQSIGSSRNAAPFINIVRQWEKDLSTISDTVEMWVIVQQKWMYLEAIFMGGDIANQLPQEAKRFEALDKNFRKIMNSAQNVQFIMKCCLADRKLDSLRQIQNELEYCQKALNDYLDAKRNAFPRFYFISDDNVLSILGGKEAQAIQEHIVKVGTVKKQVRCYFACLFLCGIYFSCQDSVRSTKQ
ncbi:unnamed protein product [Schistocephalus solidus]|uniref:DHC_N2 domain-containing protein n=1 Tax=Schistocephalus solidus TaxID=70667 RepID=A0A183TF97_SCHSO|nr:unnamed protein product [Schistocephalus solidus]